MCFITCGIHYSGLSYTKCILAALECTCNVNELTPKVRLHSAEQFLSNYISAPHKVLLIKFDFSDVQRSPCAVGSVRPKWHLAVCRRLQPGGS